jgi:hypothetical protein
MLMLQTLAGLSMHERIGRLARPTRQTMNLQRIGREADAAREPITHHGLRPSTSWFWREAMTTPRSGCDRGE